MIHQAKPETTGVQAVNIIQHLLDPQEKARFEGKTAKGFPDEKPPLPAECPIPAISDRSAQSKASSSGIVPPSDASGPSSLTAMQLEELEEVFSDEIESGKTVTMQEVRRRIIGITILSPLSVTTARLKQATNFVNYLARKTSTTTPPVSDADVGEKVSDWLNKFDDPSAQSQSVRREAWKPEETALFQRTFSTFPSLPSTKSIRKILEDDPQLNAILERDGWERVYNKIKNMFKSRR